MDVRDLIKDPTDYILSYWGSVENCPNLQEILGVASSINEMISEEKSVKFEKQLCAKQFKENIDEETKISELKKEMQSISTRLNDLRSQRKKKEASLLAFFSKKNIPSKHNQPMQFRKNAVHRESLKNIPDINVSLAGQQDEKAWDAYVAEHQSASIYHHYRWRVLIEKTFGHQSFYFVAQDEQHKIVGLLPTTRLRSRLFGDYGVSMPYFNYGGVIANHESIAEELLNAAAEFYQQVGSTHLEIRETTRQSVVWPNLTDKVSMIRALPGTADELDGQLGSKIRAQIKKSAREDIKIHRGGKELLDKFYTVFARHMRDLGTPVYTKSFFNNIIDLWPSRASIVLIELNDKPVATAFLLGNKDMLEIPWASTLRKVNSLSINMLLYWEVLCFAIDEKYKYFDFGRSTKTHNTFKFKKQWGAEPVQHYWYYWLADGRSMPNLKPDNPKFKLAIAAWRHLPVVLTKLIGPSIVKNLP